MALGIQYMYIYTYIRSIYERHSDDFGLRSANHSENISTKKCYASVQVLVYVYQAKYTGTIEGTGTTGNKVVTSYRECQSRQAIQPVLYIESRGTIQPARLGPPPTVSQYPFSISESNTSRRDAIKQIQWVSNPPP